MTKPKRKRKLIDPWREEPFKHQTPRVRVITLEEMRRAAEYAAERLEKSPGGARAYRWRRSIERYQKALAKQQSATPELRQPYRPGVDPRPDWLPPRRPLEAFQTQAGAPQP